MNSENNIISIPGTDCHQCHYFLNRIPCRDIVCGTDRIYIISCISTDAMHRVSSSTHGASSIISKDAMHRVSSENI